MRARLARWLLRRAAGLVPGRERGAWMEEWSAELDALERGRAAGHTALPDPFRFALGAVPHALWLRRQEWTLRGLADDLRLALRLLRRAPGFAAGAVVTLALGIAATGALVSVVNGLVLRPPPGIVDAGDLVQIGQASDEPGAEAAWGTFSWLDAQLLFQEAGGLLDAVGGYSVHQFTLGEGEQATPVLGHFVTGGWFDLLGTRPAAGRLLAPADDRVVGGHPVLVVSHGLWMRRWGGDPDAVGSTVTVDGAPYQIVGVAPEGYVGVHTVGLRPEVFVPAVMNPGYRGSLPFDSWRWSWLNLVGRRGEGVGEAAVRAGAEGWSLRLREAHPDNAGARVAIRPGVGVDPFDQGRIDGLTRAMILVVALVLLLTCASVANLLLARASRRSTEMAVRTALGGAGGRVARQLLAESAVLSLAATLLAVPLVALAVARLPDLLPLGLLTSIEPDARVWAALGGVAVATVLACGTAPAWLAARLAPGPRLRDGSGGTGARGGRLRDALVVAQIGLSLGLVAGTGLLVRSVVEASRADPGFESRGLTAAFVRLSFQEWDAASAAAFAGDVSERLERLPGVRSVAAGTQLPVAGGQSMGSAAPVGRPDDDLQVELAAVGPGYFETLGIPVLRGRPVGDFGAEAEPVAVVSRALAERFWPGEEAVGQRLAGDPARRVVGVVDDVRMRSLRSEANPAVYLPFEQAWQPGLAFAVAAEPGATVDPGAIRAAVQEVVPGMGVGVVDVRAAMLGALDETRAVGRLVAAFAGLALLLAAVGLYGLVALQAAARMREFGVRVALGASPESVAALIMGRAGLLASLGVALGVGVAAVVGRSLGSLLFRVPTLDPPSLLAAAAILLTTTALAAWTPARRAARVDAVECLRD